MVQCKDLSERELLEAVIAYWEGGETPDVSLSAKYPVKVIMAKMEKLDDAGWLNCGVSLRTSWIENESRLAELYPDLHERNEAQKRKRNAR